MSETGSEAQAEALEFATAWAGSMSEVFSQIAGAALAMECVEAAPPDALPPVASDMHMIAVFAGALRGEMSLRMPQSTALVLAQTMLSEERQSTAEFKPEYKDAVEELMRQVAGHVTTAMKARWGDVQLRVQPGPAPAWSAGAEGWIASASGAPIPLWMEWQLSAALSAQLRSLRPPATAQAVTEGAAMGEGNVSGGNAGVAGLPSGKFDLFMDIELDVTLRFGGRRMLLREILELSPGTVVELDREVQAPVDLLLDGKLIARGEVVVVDGNYGLRIAEVASAEIAGGVMPGNVRSAEA
jgi:flagellar motor switch protein FliN